MIASIDPTALPTLRIAGAIFLVISLLAGAYVWRSRRRFFDRDPHVANDLPAVRHARVELLLIPWLAVTTVVFVEWVRLWIN